MCVGKDCGTFRVYAISDIAIKDLWLGVSGDPPTDPKDIFGIEGLRNQKQRDEAIAKFAAGLHRRWDPPVHAGETCKGKCRCVRTQEEIGKGSEPETREWRQPMTLPTGNLMLVVRGTYKFSFRDYKGKCDSNDEVGEPISWGGGEEIALRPQREQRRPSA
ncbi:hypothetical protein BH10PSE9_BH10PSE9_22610 [soil metagenome]